MLRRFRSGLTLAAGLAFLALAGCEEGPIAPSAADEAPTGAEDLAAMQSAGHGGPKGSHLYQLNIIGVRDGHAGGLNDNQGRRIFVPLEGNTRIYLEEGDDFEVLEANGVDNRNAVFQMPDPGLAFDWDEFELTQNEASYSVFVRGLGKPGGSADITTCAEMVEGFDLRGREARSVGAAAECSIEAHTVTIESTKGNRKFQNVTSQLLTLRVDILDEETGEVLAEDVLVPIFDEKLEGVFWEYENNGLRLAQVRFYPCSTNVETGDSTC